MPALVTGFLALAFSSLFSQTLSVNATSSSRESFPLLWALPIGFQASTEGRNGATSPALQRRVDPINLKTKNDDVADVVVGEGDVYNADSQNRIANEGGGGDGGSYDGTYTTLLLPIYLQKMAVGNSEQGWRIGILKALNISLSLIHYAFSNCCLLLMLWRFLHSFVDIQQNAVFSLSVCQKLYYVHFIQLFIGQISSFFFTLMIH